MHFPRIREIVFVNFFKSSSRPYLSEIRIPTLILNALDDPFLAKESYPVEEAKQNQYLFLEIPPTGGHVGFVTFNSYGEYWHETRVTSFIIDGH